MAGQRAEAESRGGSSAASEEGESSERARNKQQHRKRVDANHARTERLQRALRAMDPDSASVAEAVKRTKPERMREEDATIPKQSFTELMTAGKDLESKSFEVISALVHAGAEQHLGFLANLAKFYLGMELQFILDLSSAAFNEKHADPVLHEFLYVMERQCIFEMQHSEVTRKHAAEFEALTSLAILPSNFPWNLAGTDKKQ